MKNLIYITSIITIFALTSCQKHERIQPSGTLVTHTLPIPEGYFPITGIEIFDMECNLYIYISEDENEEDKVEITVDDNVWPHILWRTIGRGSWRAGEEPNMKYNVDLYYHHVSFMHRKPNLTVVLTVKNLDRIGLSGASIAHLRDTLVSDSLRIVLQGASMLRSVDRGRIEANHITAVLSGASSLNLMGYSQTLDLTMSGASQMSGHGMVCDNLIANFSGASVATLTVQETLSVKLSGASTLNFAGNPEIIFYDVSGASVVRRQ